MSLSRRALSSSERRRLNVSLRSGARTSFFFGMPVSGYIRPRSLSTVFLAGRAGWRVDATGDLGAEARARALGAPHEGAASASERLGEDRERDGRGDARRDEHEEVLPDAPIPESDGDPLRDCRTPTS